LTEAFVYDAFRTPRGRGKQAGSLHSVKPVSLVVGLINELRSRFPNLDPQRIDDLVLGVGGKSSLYYLPLTLAEPEGWITETAAARLLRRAAEALPGVAAGSCRIVPLSGARVPRGGRLPREPLRVRLEIAVHPDLALREASSAVRSRVLRAADDHLGLDLAEVDIAVVDVLDTPDPPTGGRTGRTPS